MRTIPLIRCLPKMSPSSSTSIGSQIATWRRSFTWTRHDFDLISDHRRLERCSSDHRRFSLNPARHDILPHRQSQLSDRFCDIDFKEVVIWSLIVNQTSYNDFFEVYITETVTLSPNGRFDQFNFSINLSTIMWPIVLCPHWSKSPSADVRYDMRIQISVVGPQ